MLELTAADELVGLENMGVLQKNGFEVALDGDQPAGRRLKLLAQPVSKNTEFDIQGEVLASAVLAKIVPEINVGGCFGLGSVTQILKRSYTCSGIDPREPSCAHPRRGRCLQCARAAGARWSVRRLTLSK